MACAVHFGHATLARYYVVPCAICCALVFMFLGGTIGWYQAGYNQSATDLLQMRAATLADATRPVIFAEDPDYVAMGCRRWSSVREKLSMLCRRSMSRKSACGPISRPSISRWKPDKNLPRRAAVHRNNLMLRPLS